MKDFKAWVAAIRREIDDDTVRLACADWLDERDQSQRAEFIRVQCELARIAGDDPRRPELWQREQELLAEYQDEWRKEIPGWATQYAGFHRGFVDQVSCSVKTFATKAGGLLARAPITSAVLSSAHSDALAALTDCPHLAAIRDLGLQDLSSGPLSALLRSPHAAGLREFHVTTLADPQAAVRRSLMSALRSATFTGFTVPLNWTYDEAELRELARFPMMRSLENLQLYSYITFERMALEWSSDTGPPLRELDLNRASYLTSRTVRSLGTYPFLRGLTRLDLGGVRQLDDEGMVALAEAPHLKNLTDLNLDYSRITDAGVRTLIESPNLTRLSRIDLYDTQVSDRWPFRQSERIVGPGARFIAHVLWVRDVRK